MDYIIPLSDYEKITELVSKINFLLRLNNPQIAIFQIELLKVNFCSPEHSQFVQRSGFNICNLFLRILYNNTPNNYY